MRLIVISDEALYPANSGGRQLVINETRALVEVGFEVHLIVFHRETISNLNRELHLNLASDVTFIRRPSPLLLSVIRPLDSYQIASRWNRNARSAVKKVDGASVIIAHHDWTMPLATHLKERFDARIVLRSHNDELRFLRDMKAASSGLRRAYLARELLSIGRSKLNRLMAAADEVWLVSESDVDAYSNGRPVVVPPVLHENETVISRQTTPCVAEALSFTGALDVAHNVDGLLWFCQLVMPKIRSAVPGAQLIIAGRRAPSSLVRELSSFEGVGVAYIGEVEDVTSVLLQSRMSINPALSGSGINMKCGPSAILGVPIVSTSFGARGIEALFGGEVRPTSDASELAALCVKLLVDDLFWMRESARIALAASRYSPNGIGQLMRKRISSLVAMDEN